MDKKWEEKVLEASKRENEEQEDLFLTLVDQVRGKSNLEIAKILMKTFQSKPDYGTQERVISVLATFDDRTVTQAILEELPRLVKEAPEWAEDLVGPEVDNRPDLLINVLKLMNDPIQDSFKTLLSDKDFQSFYPNAIEIIKSL